MENTDNKSSKGSMSVVALLAACASLVLATWSHIENGKKSKSYEEAISRLEERAEKIEKSNEENKNALYRLAIQSVIEEEGFVDFTDSSMQNITPGFNVGQLEMKEHLAGVKISGVVINTQAVSHQSATFSIKIQESEKDFSINKIRSGGSSSFTVYVPDVNPKEIKFGRIKYKNSSISYFKPTAPP